MLDVTLRQNACRGLVNLESAMYNERECARLWSGRLYTHMRRRAAPLELVLYLRIADRRSDRGADFTQVWEDQRAINVMLARDFKSSPGVAEGQQDWSDGSTCV